MESVFARLKEKHKKVYRQPDATFVNDYIDLREPCVIVKTLVTESPLMDEKSKELLFFLRCHQKVDGNDRQSEGAVRITSNTLSP